MVVTLDTSHFEMSELNALAPLNAAESKKKRERQEQRKEVREWIRKNSRAKKGRRMDRGRCEKKKED